MAGSRGALGRIIQRDISQETVTVGYYSAVPRVGQRAVSVGQGTAAPLFGTAREGTLDHSPFFSSIMDEVIRGVGAELGQQDSEFPLGGFVFGGCCSPTMRHKLPWSRMCVCLVSSCGAFRVGLAGGR